MENPNFNIPTPQPEKPHNRLPFQITLGILLIISLAVLGYAVYQQFSKPQIEIESGSKIVDKTAGWKTYKNENYGFQTQYPTDFSLTQHDYKDWISIMMDGPKDCQKEHSEFYCFDDYVSIEVNNNSRNLTLAQFIGENYTVAWNQQGFKSIGGKEFIIFMPSNTEAYSTMYGYADNENKKLYFITVMSGIENTLSKKILSTFKFTDSNNETANWKTYKNEQYGFEIKYPSNFLNQDPIVKNIDCSNFNINKCPLIDRQGSILMNTDEYSTEQGFVKKMKNITVNNTSFCHQTMTDPGAGSGDLYDYYFTNLNDRCFSLTLHTSINADSNILNKIISTFKFTK